MRENTGKDGREKGKFYEIGQRIQKLRKERGYKNQHSFYDVVFGTVGSDNSKNKAISKIENGDIRLDDLLKISRVLGVSIDYLVHGKEMTLREILESVSKLFFLSNSEIIQNGETIEIKFHKTPFSNYFQFPGYEDELIYEIKEMVSRCDNKLEVYIRQFLQNLAVTRNIDNVSIANSCNSINLDDKRKSFYFPNPFSVSEKDSTFYHILGESGINMCRITDSPYTIPAKNYLKDSLSKIPSCTPIEIFNQDIDEVLQGLKYLRKVQEK